MPRIVLRLLLAAAILPLAGLAAPAHAQPDSTAGAPSSGRLTGLYDRFQVVGSLSTVVLNAQIRLDSEDGDIGTDIDAEDDLGLDQVIFEPRLAVSWRAGRRHELEGGYQFARRTAEKTIERDLDWGDSTYHAGRHVQSVLDSDQLFVNYRYAAFARDNWQAGLSVGLGALFITMGLAAQSNLTAGEAAFDLEKNTVAPVGSIGIYGRYLAGNRWYFEGDARTIRVDIDRFDVDVLEANAAVRYFFSRRFGVEGGLGTSRITVDIGQRVNLDFGASGRLKYSLANGRLGVVWVP